MRRETRDTRSETILSPVPGERKERSDRRGGGDARITIRSGKYKNKKLTVPEKDVRPTSDKIRQAIFNVILHADFSTGLDGANVLDAFAGTGAVAIEALSRGAGHAWCMEKNAAVKKVLDQNIQSCLSTPASPLGRGEINALLCDAAHPPIAPMVMQIIFLDPPYEKDLLSPAITALAAQGWSDHETLWVIETKKDEAWNPPAGLEIVDTRRYGNTEIHFATFSRK